ncbi:MAG: hypothetical protein LBT70_01415, partial [Holosporaceae bacterium]|nr:hypothetical protein [Holosporaceae bacterium]
MPTVAKEKREAAKKQREEVESKTKEEDSKAATFSEIFEKYIVQAEHDKGASSCKDEICFFKNWIAPNIGDKGMNEITPDMLEQIKKKMS